MHEREHRAGNRADPREGTENTGHLRQAFIARDGAGDPVFRFLDDTVDPLLQRGRDVLEHHGGAAFLMRMHLGQQPFAHIDQLRTPGRQSAEKA